MTDRDTDHPASIQRWGIQRWRISSAHVTAEVQSLGAMLGPAWFTLGGRQVQPFAVAPWAEEAGADEELPGILRALRGEWPCVPYGMPDVRADLPSDWMPPEEAHPFVDPFPHGFAANHPWRAEHVERDRIALSIDYPEDHPVRRLTRTIAASGDAPALDIGLTIEVRRAVDLPLGIHPTFRLSEGPGRVLLDLGDAARAWTPPVALEPHIAWFEPGLVEGRLSAIPLAGGGEVDATRLPLDANAEELILVTGHEGTARLTYLDEDFAVEMAWDAAVFPSCQLWLSNRGREYPPWNRRFMALGVEPICAAFDLGTRVSSRPDTPLARAGVPCTLHLSPDVPFSTRYRIGVV